MRGVLMGAALVLFAAGCEEGDRPASGLDEGLAAVTPRHVPPSLETTIEWRDPRSDLGWGRLDLSAHPERHEIRVSLLAGIPVAEKRWDRCQRLSIEVDGEETGVPVSYAGVPMEHGIYDAVSGELSIEDVRRMADGRRVRADVCGRIVPLGPHDRAELRSFVRRFEEMATYGGPPSSPPRRELDEDPDLVTDQELELPEPV